MNRYGLKYDVTVSMYLGVFSKLSVSGFINDKPGNVSLKRLETRYWGNISEHF